MQKMNLSQIMLQAKNKTCEHKCFSKIGTSATKSSSARYPSEKKVKNLSTLETIVISKGISFSQSQIWVTIAQEHRCELHQIPYSNMVTIS